MTRFSQQFANKFQQLKINGEEEQMLSQQLSPPEVNQDGTPSKIVNQQVKQRQQSSQNNQPSQRKMKNSPVNYGQEVMHSEATSEASSAIYHAPLPLQTKQPSKMDFTISHTPTNMFAAQNALTTMTDTKSSRPSLSPQKKNSKSPKPSPRPLNTHLFQPVRLSKGQPIQSKQQTSQTVVLDLNCPKKQPDHNVTLEDVAGDDYMAFQDQEVPEEQEGDDDLIKYHDTTVGTGQKSEDSFSFQIPDGKSTPQKQGPRIPRHDRKRRQKILQDLHKNGEPVANVSIELVRQSGEMSLLQNLVAQTSQTATRQIEEIQEERKRVRRESLSRISADGTSSQKHLRSSSLFKASSKKINLGGTTYNTAAIRRYPKCDINLDSSGFQESDQYPHVHTEEAVHDFRNNTLQRSQTSLSITRAQREGTASEGLNKLVLSSVQNLSKILQRTHTQDGLNTSIDSASRFESRRKTHQVGNSKSFTVSTATMPKNPFKSDEKPKQRSTSPEQIQPSLQPTLATRLKNMNTAPKNHSKAREERKAKQTSSSTSIGLRTANKKKDISPSEEALRVEAPLGRDSRKNYMNEEGKKKYSPDTTKKHSKITGARTGSASGSKVHSKRGTTPNTTNITISNVNLKQENNKVQATTEVVSEKEAVSSSNNQTQRSSKKQRQQIKALIRLQKQCKVHLMRKTIMARLKKLASVKARILGLYKGWKVRQFMKQPSVKALIKEIQVAQKRDSKQTKQNYSKEQLRKNIKSNIIDLKKKLVAYMKKPESSLKGLTAHHSRKISAGRNTGLLFKKQSTPSVPQEANYETLPKQMTNPEKSAHNVIDTLDELKVNNSVMIQNDKTSDLFEEPVQTKNEDKGKDLPDEVHIPLASTMKKDPTKQSQSTLRNATKSSSSKAANYTTECTVKSLSKDIAAKLGKTSKVDLLTPLLSPRLMQARESQMVFSSRSPAKRERTGVGKQIQEMIMTRQKSQTTRPLTATNPKPKQIQTWQYPAVNDNKLGVTKQNSAITSTQQNKGAITPKSVHSKVNFKQERRASPTKRDKSQLKQAQSPLKRMKSPTDAKPARSPSRQGSLSFSQSSIEPFGKKKSACSALNSMNAGKSSRNIKPPLSLVDLEIKEPSSKRNMSPIKKSRDNSDLPPPQAAKNKLKSVSVMVTKSPPTQAQTQDNTKTGQKSIHKITGLFRDIRAQTLSMQQTPKINKANQRREVTKLQDQQQEKRLVFERMIIDMRRDFEMACLEQSAAQQKQFQ